MHGTTVLCIQYQYDSPLSFRTCIYFSNILY